MSADLVNATARDERSQVSFQNREKEIRELKESLRSCKCRTWVDLTCFGVGAGVILVTVFGFWALAYQIIVRQLNWLQLSGLLGLSVLWLCLVTVVVLSLEGRKRR